MSFNTRNFCLIYHLLLSAVIRVQGYSCTKREIFILVAKDHRLKKCVIYETQVSSLLECSQMCLKQRPQCQSINFEKKKTYSRCQLNNETRATKADELVPDRASNYYETIAVRRLLYTSPTAVNTVFKGIYKVINLRTQRWMFSAGSNILASDHNYYNRGFWKIINHGQGRYLFKNHYTGKYLFSEGDEIPGDHGCEGGAGEAPSCLGSDANYDNRALWKIVDQGEGKYLIESVVNFRYVFSYGEPPVRTEGYNHSPRCVMSDGNYENRALWEIVKN